jgi:hypothetical protein
MNGGYAISSVPLVAMIAIFLVVIFSLQVWFGFAAKHNASG